MQDTKPTASASAHIGPTRVVQKRAAAAGRSASTAGGSASTTSGRAAPTACGSSFTATSPACGRSATFLATPLTLSGQLGQFGLQSVEFLGEPLHGFLITCLLSLSELLLGLSDLLLKLLNSLFGGLLLVLPHSEGLHKGLHHLAQVAVLALSFGRKGAAVAQRGYRISIGVACLRPGGSQWVGVAQRSDSVDCCGVDHFMSFSISSPSV